MNGERPVSGDYIVYNGTMNGSALGSGSSASNNIVIDGSNWNQELMGNLQQRLDRLLAALDNECDIDEEMRRYAKRDVGRLKDAANQTAPDGSTLRTRWADLRETLAGVARAGSDVAKIVASVGEVVAALAPA
jgi:hypothetical protein